MARRGRDSRLGLEDEYWKLIAEGLGTVAACRRLGICSQDGVSLARRDRRTGAAARQCAGALLTVFVVVGTPADRFAALAWVGVRKIAVRSGRSASAVSRHCARAPPGTTVVGMTATSLMLARHSAAPGDGLDVWAATASCVGLSRTSFDWRGAPSRSLDGCVAPTRRGRAGTCSRDDPPGPVHRSQRSE